MNKNTLEGQWEQAKGHLQTTWGKLTNDDLDQIKGNSKILAGKLQERYGTSQEESEKNAKTFHDTYPSNSSTDSASNSNDRAA